MVNFKDIQSVILCYNLDDCVLSGLMNQSALSLCKIVSTDDLTEFKTKVAGATHIVGMVVKWNSHCQDEVNYFIEHQEILITLGFNPLAADDFKVKAPLTQSSSIAAISTTLNEFIHDQKHPDLGAWMEKCANFLMPFQVEGETLKFVQASEKVLGHDYIYYTNLQLDPYIARIELQVDVERCSKILLETLRLDERLIHDFFKEMVNQYAGIITRPFLNNFMEPILEVPLEARSSEIKERFSDVCLPFSVVNDQFDIFQFKVAFINSKGGSAFRVPMDPAWDPIQTIEFL